MLLREEGVDWVRETMEELRAGENFHSLGLPELLNTLVEKGHKVNVHYIHGHWMDVNNLQDLNRAEDFQRGWSHAIR